MSAFFVANEHRRDFPVLRIARAVYLTTSVGIVAPFRLTIPRAAKTGQSPTTQAMM